MVRAEDLAQENPERDQRGEDPVQPAGDGGQCLGDGLLGEDLGKRQVAGLKKLAPEKLDLLPKPPLVRMAHPCGLLATDGCVGNHHLRKRGPSRLYHSGLGTCCRTTCHSSMGPRQISRTAMRASACRTSARWGLRFARVGLENL